MEYWDDWRSIWLKKKYGSWEKQTMDRKSLDSNTEVMRFWPLFHDSNIPSFHVGGTKPVSLKIAWFQYIIEIPRRLSCRYWSSLFQNFFGWSQAIAYGEQTMQFGNTKHLQYVILQLTDQTRLCVSRSMFLDFKKKHNTWAVNKRQVH